MTDDSLLAKLAEEFTAEMRAGKPADIERYVRKYPELAERIRELFPTLMMLENAAVEREAGTAQQAGLSPGTVFGSYRILREIGRGGMGIVYEAVKVTVEKRVALKILPLQTPVDSHQVERFFREARITSDLKHPNIVPIYDAGKVDDTVYFAMRYIEGRGLDRILRLMQQQTHSQSQPSFALDSRSYQISPHGAEAVGDANNISSAARRIRANVPARFDDYLKWVAKIGIQAASGLEYAHKHRLIHRDIKPSNLLLEENGVLWIADFGLARNMEDPTLTRTGQLLGTPRYMSPEQTEAAKRQVDHRSDIYSLGATLYELLTCRPVFEGNTPQEVLPQILAREPAEPHRLNPSIPKDLETVVMKAIAKRPEDRYQSAKDLADDLQRWINTVPVKARRIGPVLRSLGWCRKNLRYVTVMAALILVSILIGGLYFRDTVRERSEKLDESENLHVKTESSEQPTQNNQAFRFPSPISSSESIADSALSDKAQSPNAPESGEMRNQGQTIFKSVKEPIIKQAGGTSSRRDPSSGKSAPKIVSEQTAPLPGQAVPGLAAGKTRIRIGTVAPKDSLWHEVLKYIKQEWQKVTNGEVSITIYAGGILGDGPEMIQMVRAGRIQAVVLSSVGLSRIDNSINCLQMPMMISSYEELDYIRDRIGPHLEKRLEERGFRLLFWAEAGWVHTFAKEPVRTPDDLRMMKLFTQAGDPEMEKLWEKLGFRVAPLSLTDLMPSLQTGMINAFNFPPEYALLVGAYRQAPNMVGIKWMPLVTGMVIDLSIWEKLPDKYQSQMLEAAREAGSRYRNEIRKMGDESILEMRQRGLKVIELDADMLTVWQREAENAYPMLRGRYAPADLCDEAIRLRDEYRKTNFF